MLLNWADRAREYGANSVFYDQLGYGERATNWDLSREFPVPNMHVIADKAVVFSAGTVLTGSDKLPIVVPKGIEI